MKKKIFLIFILLLNFISKKNLIFAQIPTTCFEIQSILVDACGNPEGENEMVRFVTGPNSLNISNLIVTWPNNIYLNICQNAQTATNVDTLNAAIQSCGYILEPSGGILPPGKTVILVTSTNMNPFSNSFANLSDTIYMIFQCPGNTSGHFKNYQLGSGPRTLVMEFTGSCNDSVTYIVDSLIDQSGNHFAQDGATVVFDFAGNAVYTNPGCQAPIVPINVTLTPDSVSVTPGTVINVSAVINSGNYISYFWSGGIGSFGNTSLLNTTYQTDNLFTGTEYLLFGIVNSCNDTLYDTVVVQISNTSSTLELMNSQIWVPNVFTPDDIYNNNFNIKSPYSNISVSGIIFNTLGEEIATWNSLCKGWNGKTKGGMNVPEGIYYYLVNISLSNREFRNLSGPLILLR